MLIHKWDSAGLKHCNHGKDFINYLNYMDNILEKVDEYNPKSKIKLNILLVSIPQSYFAVPKDITINSTYHFTLKIQRAESLN